MERSQFGTDHFPKGSSSPYHLILGTMPHRDYAVLLSATDDLGILRDTLISKIPDRWYRFGQLVFVTPGEALPLDAIATSETDWCFSTSDVDGFIDQVLDRIDAMNETQADAISSEVAP